MQTQTIRVCILEIQKLEFCNLEKLLKLAKNFADMNIIKCALRLHKNNI